MLPQRNLSDPFLNFKPTIKPDNVFPCTTFEDGLRESLTPLQEAVLMNKKDRVKILLKSGVEVDKTTTRGMMSVTALMLAISKGYTQIVRSLVFHGANLDFQETTLGFTPLCMAAQLGHKDIVEILIDHRANLHSKTKLRNTPLHLAAEVGHQTIARLLLDKGANPEARNIQLMTPLHLAAYHNRLEIVKMLVEFGSDLNAGGTEVEPAGTLVKNITALELAVQWGHTNVVEVLVKGGANTATCNTAGQTPLHIAAIRGFQDCVGILLKSTNCNINAKEYISHSTALHVAVSCNHKEIVGNLIKDGAKVNVNNKDKFTPLHLALQNKLYTISHMLIEAGADIEAQDLFDWTPLHNATYNCFSAEIVKVLVMKGAKVNCRTSDGRTPLHMASEQGGTEILEILLKSGSKINARDNRKWTALHFAAYDGHVEASRMLLDRGTEINAKTTKSTTPLHFAVNQGHEEVVKLLIEKGADINIPDHTNWTALHFAVDDVQLELTKLLVSHGADLRVKNSDGCTPFHLAVHRGSWELVDILLKEGPDLEGTNVAGMTPLHLAAYSGKLNVFLTLMENGSCFDSSSSSQLGSRTPLDMTTFGFKSIEKNSIAKLLKLTEVFWRAVKNNNLHEIAKCLQQGVSVNWRSVRCQTALIYASWKGWERTVGVLLSEGAKVNSRSSKGGTALHYAAKFGHCGVVRVLLGNGAIYDIKNTPGTKTPLDLAKESRKSEIVELLKNVEKAFRIAVEDRPMDVRIHSLLSLGNDQNYLNVLLGACNSNELTLRDLLFRCHDPGTILITGVVENFFL